MGVIALKERQDIVDHANVNTAYGLFDDLLTELRKKELPDEIVERINHDVGELNATPLTGDELKKLIKRQRSSILKLVEKELKIVPKNRYRNLWLAVGMSAFGIPIGAALGVSMDNMAMLGTGLPIGMAIGIAVGIGLDKKAAKEGRQLDVDV